MSFDGIDDYVNCGNDVSLRITGSITIEVWMKGSNANGIVGRTFQGNWVYGHYGLFPYIWAAYLGGQDRAHFYTVSFDNMADGDWHHLVATRDGTNMSVYIDGFLANSTVCGSGDFSTGKYISIGRVQEDSYFKGTIGEVAIYNRALSATEAKEHYNKGKP